VKPKRKKIKSSIWLLPFNKKTIKKFITKPGKEVKPRKGVKFKTMPGSKKWRKLPHNVVVVKGKPDFKIDPKDRRHLVEEPKLPVVIAKVQKATRHVNRDAWDFTPEVSLAVGIDPKHGRIMVKELHVGKETGQAALLQLKQAIASAARLYCTEERMARALFVQNCTHPKYRIKKKRYEVDDDVFEDAYFCTRCGTRIERVDKATELRVSIEEMQEAKKAARKPKIRRKA
jgi:hypothetical protein